MGLFILRFIFIFVSCGVGFSVMIAEKSIGSNNPFWLFISILLFALCVVAGDIFSPKKRVDWISSVYFGLFVGILLTATIGFAITPFLPVDASTDVLATKNNVLLVVGIMLCYLCISFLIQTRDDFRFIIPYVEFRKNLKGSRPLILDTSVIIDGRLADVMETMLVDSRLIMPRFAISELQRIADSADRGRRTRGRRGLDILNRLQNMKGIDFQLDDTDLPEFRGQPVDLKLVALAKHLEGKLVTNDYNLNKVAKVQGVDVINLNDLANAMKPIFLPGERIEVEIVKNGEEPAQGIGYLDDGTMVVVDGGRDQLGGRSAVTVTSVLQTSAGRMIFGRFENRIKKMDSDNSGMLQERTNPEYRHRSTRTTASGTTVSGTAGSGTTVSGTAGSGTNASGTTGSGTAASGTNANKTPKHGMSSNVNITRVNSGNDRYKRPSSSQKIKKM
ncbi:MAG: PIN domain-containing protein [Thermoguttaceae bacterium]